jgi:hypothetical protein
VGSQRACVATRVPHQLSVGTVTQDLSICCSGTLPAPTSLPAPLPPPSPHRFSLCVTHPCRDSYRGTTHQRPPRLSQHVRRAARITPVVVGCAGGLGPRETGERSPPLITRFHHGEIQAVRRHPQLYTTHHTRTWVVRIIQTIDAASASPGTVNGLSGRESEKCLGSKCLPLHVQVMQPGHAVVGHTGAARGAAKSGGANIRVELPCKHLCVCGACAEQLTRPRTATCPVCRGPNRGTMKVKCLSALRLDEFISTSPNRRESLRCPLVWCRRQGRMEAAADAEPNRATDQLGVADRAKTSANRGPKRDRRSIEPLRVCSNVSLYPPPARIHSTHTCAQLHSHTLSPSLHCSGCETGLESLFPEAGQYRG